MLKHTLNISYIFMVSLYSLRKDILAFIWLMVARLIIIY